MTDASQPTMPVVQIMTQPASGLSTPPTVSIIVVSYNTRQMTLECLRSVFEQTRRTTFEVIVIDNESADGSAAAIEAEFADRLRLIRSGANLGFAKANNVAAEHATGEYLLLLNPDTLVLDGAIDKLVAFAGHRPQAGIWGGRTVDGHGILDPTSVWRRYTPWAAICQAAGLSTVMRRSAVFNSEGYGGWTRDTEREVDIVTGCFLLTTRALWQQLGGFNPVFFMYGEEADLCLRARSLGAKPLFTPAAEIVHYGGASERVRADKMVRLLRAKAQMIALHWPPLWRPFGRLMLRLWALRAMLIGRRSIDANPAVGSTSAGEWRAVWQRRSEWLKSQSGMSGN